MKKHHFKRKIIMGGLALSALFAVLDLLAKLAAEPVDIDEDNDYLDMSEGLEADETLNWYERWGKPTLDRISSFFGLVFLAPALALISLAIFVDDPGPVFFTQKRVGKDKRYFYLHKFRTMKMSTPHDVPTHQLAHPEQYITRVGAFLRRTSLDELPQIWDIFRGKMSVIGPRPALWNQEDLVAEREKYDANSVQTALSGLAQVQGRDELEIPLKAKWDGTYVKILRQNGWKALFFDLGILLRTVFSVFRGEGVVEGGTGSLALQKEADTEEDQAAKTEFGFQKQFSVDLSHAAPKKVLITGARSYIGESFEGYARRHYPGLFAIDTLDLRDEDWRAFDFGGYDAVFHVAGIAHAPTGTMDAERRAQYYAINTDLAIEVAKKAKEAGVGQFVFMSSMIVYGNSAPFGKSKWIDEHTKAAPADAYGDSKWRADRGIRALSAPNFRTAILRSPMVYGRDSKGNYRKLAKLAKWLPVFPATDNRRSMLYIGNLCEFLCLLIQSGGGGIFFPQNKEYVNTAELVAKIAACSGRQMHSTKALNPLVRLCSVCPGRVGAMANKAFGNSVYAAHLSEYPGMDYQKYGWEESICETEGQGSRKNAGY